MSQATGESVIRVLVVEDDARLLEIIARHLDRMGYAVREASDGTQALELLRERPAHVVLSDVRMPGTDGRTLLEVVTSRYPETRVILMTAFGTVNAAVEAMSAGAYSYLTKPFKVDEIAAVLRNVTCDLAFPERQPPPAGERAPPGPFDRLIGRSAAMGDVRRKIQDAARVASPVLITGRSGTGKELVARSIHFGGPRAKCPFVPVNCAAIPETLFESEMFGHARGAFTGATAGRAGLIVQSHGGTLFLDEAAEIPLKEQAKLLRVLEERKVRRLGEAATTAVDIRVICATNRDVEAMVKQGEFREDLYFRLNVIRLHLPELSRRLEDLPALADQLLTELFDETGITCLGFGPGALDELSARRWPGNVRELRNVIECAMVQAAGRRISPQDLREGPGAMRPMASPAKGGERAMSLSSLADVEREHIEEVLRACGWNRSAAARILGIDRRTLFSKIKRYGLLG